MDNFRVKITFCMFVTIVTLRPCSVNPVITCYGLCRQARQERVPLGLEKTGV